MQPIDLFPIGRCSPRLQAAILAEFDGRCPTFQEVANIPLKRWMTVPGVGYAVLSELDSIIQSQYGRSDGNSVARLTDGELVARLRRLQRELSEFRQAIQDRIGKPQI